MLGLELTRGQWIQIAVVAVVLVFSIFFFWHGTHAPSDHSLAVWLETGRIGVDPARPVSHDNPADPAKATAITVFAFYDGQLKITEYPKDTSQPPTLHLTPDHHRATFELYKDPLAPLDHISDGYKYTLTDVAYRVADGGSPNGLLRPAGLDRDQRLAETAARRQMRDELGLIAQSVDTGNCMPQTFKKVLAAFDAYKHTPGEAAKDAAKSAAAWNFIAVAVDYLNQVNVRRDAVIKKYADTLDHLLTADQKAKLAAAGKDLIRQHHSNMLAKAG